MDRKIIDKIVEDIDSVLIRFVNVDRIDQDTKHDLLVSIYETLKDKK